MESKLLAALLAFGACQFILITSCAATCDSFDGFDDYFANWENLYYQTARRMYPFGENYCDTNATDSQKVIGFDPQIDFDVPFYGSTYRGLWISPQGFVALDKNTNPQRVGYVYKDQWPNPQYPLDGDADVPFIAPFYAESDFRESNNLEPARLSYRVLRPESAANQALADIMRGTLELISRDVRKAVIGADFFHAKHGLIVTWFMVSYAVRSCLLDNCNRNTYQMALVTDGVSTYTVFNYYQMEWMGGSGYENCNPATGTDFETPGCKPAHVGFNSGSGRGFTPLPHSNTPAVVDYDRIGESGSDVPGRWYYDVTADVIRHGGCTNDTNFGATWPLIMEPQGGPMFGGHPVEVAGPCFRSNQDIVCRFGDQIAEGLYTGNMMKALCVAPRQYRVGPVTIEVSVTGGNAYYYKNSYLVSRQEMEIPEGRGVKVTSLNNDWLNPSRIRLEWDPRNLTQQDNDRLSIHIVAYREDEQEGIWRDLYTLDDDLPNNGLYEFTPESNMCEQQNDFSVCTQFAVAAFRVGVNRFTPNPENPSLRGEDWPSLLCRDWHGRDSQDSNWRQTLPPCPCTLSQVLVDFGRLLPDVSCNGARDDDATCAVHRGAKACYQSTYVANIGASTICCYDNSRNLMYAADSVAGSFLARSSPSGKAPYGQSPRIPSLSHWETDLVPYHRCCRWQTDMQDCFSLYMTSRPTVDCINYEPPGTAAAFGDPHFITFDGTSYTFNGHGEFHLLLAEGVEVGREMVTFKLQARMEELDDDVKATMITAIVMQLNEGPIVSFSANAHNTRERTAVRVDSRPLNFSTHALYWQEFPDFVIINTDPEDDLSYKNFTVAFRVGVGIQVTWINDFLQCRVSLSPDFKDKTAGLLGVWSGDGDDDFKPRPQSIQPLPPSSSQEEIHKQFGLTWFVQESETLFFYLYRSQLNYNYYKNPDYEPVYEPIAPPGGSVSEGDVSQLCGQNEACRFDYLVAQSENIARNTLHVSEWDEETRELAEKVLSCGWLEIPNSIKREPISYLVGSEVHVTGCRYGYQPEGTTRTYTCRQNDDGTVSWSPGIGVRCIYTGGGLAPSMIAAITVPSIIVGLLLIIGIIVLCLYCRKRRKRKELERKRKNADQEEFNDLDVIGYGKNPNMWINPNNPVANNQNKYNPQTLPKKEPPKETTKEPTETKVPPIQQSTPKAEPVVNQDTTLSKKHMDSSTSSVEFFDKESVDGKKFRSRSMDSLGKAVDHVEALPRSPSSDRILLPKSPKTKTKKKKKKESQSEDESDSVAYSNPPSVDYSFDGRPRRPPLGPTPTSKPNPNIPAPAKKQSGNPNLQQTVVYPNPQFVQRPDLGHMSDSSGSQGYYQRDLEQFYKQQDSMRSHQPSSQGHRPTNKPRPYQYPTTNRNNPMPPSYR